MQAEEARPVDCPEQVARELQGLLACYRARLRARLALLCVRSRHCLEVLAADEAAARLAKRLSLPPFTAGIHVARLCRGRLHPLLGLLAVIDGVRDHYAVVDEEAEKLFLYGRDVFRERVVELKVAERCGSQPLIVVNRFGDPLGFAAYRPQGRVILANLLDAGWYLRSGV